MNKCWNSSSVHPRFLKAKQTPLRGPTLRLVSSLQHSTEQTEGITCVSAVTASNTFSLRAFCLGINKVQVTKNSQKTLTDTSHIKETIWNNEIRCLQHCNPVIQHFLLSFVVAETLKLSIITLLTIVCMSSWCFASEMVWKDHVTLLNKLKPYIVYYYVSMILL